MILWLFFCVGLYSGIVSAVVFPLRVSGGRPHPGGGDHDRHHRHGRRRRRHVGRGGCHPRPHRATPRYAGSDDPDPS